MSHPEEPKLRSAEDMRGPSGPGFNMSPFVNRNWNQDQAKPANVTPDGPRLRARRQAEIEVRNSLARAVRRMHELYDRPEEEDE